MDITPHNIEAALRLQGWIRPEGAGDLALARDEVQG
jgi:hypothetical protein